MMSQSTASHPLVLKTRDSLKQIGYRDDLLLPYYGFSDVLGDSDGALTVPLAAFAQEPTSYKTACFGVTLTTSDNPQEVEYCRALGAPMVLALRPDTNTWRLWKMMARGTPEPRGEFSTDALVREIINRQDQWQPGEVLRAKNIAFPEVSPQLDFYDVGLVAAIEADVHRKLNGLLKIVVADARGKYRELHDQDPDSLTYRALFQVIFRFMAAKLLGDRKHKGNWLNEDAQTVLQAVHTFYNDPADTLPPLDAPIRNRAWETIRKAIHFQNLSVEALAYVYENTFVDVTTRRTLGTHATPYEVAEYVVRALPLQDLLENERTVFEPFCGAAPFLIAAMGRLRGLLEDKDMDAAKRHEYFKQMLVGMETDPFAREVAFHSLILADYPNSNGWNVLADDVFSSPRLTDNLTQANVVLCNPPYGLFDAQEKQTYVPSSAYKGTEALALVLQKPPKMLGFVLPLAYLNGQSYRKVRDKINATYKNVDIVKLPDNIFQHSSVETVLLLAYGEVQGTPRHRFAALSKPAYKQFRHTRSIGWEQNPLERLWAELGGAAKLSSMVEIHRGIRYAAGFDTNDPTFVSNVERAGFVPGLSQFGDDFRLYSIGRIQYLTTEAQIEVGADWPWKSPKVIVSAARKSRGQWVTVAAVDYGKLVCTQNFHCVWPDLGGLTTEVIAALINGPVANAWLSQQGGKRHSQVRFYATIPLPTFSPTATELITRYVDRYARLQGTAEGMNVLLKIDAAVLDAYGLSQEAESELLAWFDGARRPGVPGFTEYGTEFEQARAEYRQELMSGINQRRVELIRRKSLSPAERQELEELQTRMSGLVNAQYPLPFAALEQMEVFAQQLKGREGPR